MPNLSSGPLTGALGACVLTACRLPTAHLELSDAPAQPHVTTSAPPARTRALGRDLARPRVVHAELLTADHLRLHFNEPLASLAGVDPNDFRLSMGMAKTYRLYAYAYYLDISETLVDDHELLKLERMNGQGDTIDVYLNPAMDLAYCHEFAAEIADMKAEPGIRAEGGLYLHYSPGASPVADPNGNTLAPMGAEWVLRGQRGGDEAYEMYFEGPPARRALQGVIPIECGPVPVEPVSSP